MAKVLVTGATGFIGKRLVHELLASGHEVYALSRLRGAVIRENETKKLHMLYGSIGHLEKEGFPQDIEAAYYLVHSLGSLIRNLPEEERKTAEIFLQDIEKTSCRQIIFLGGIIESENNLSPHLAARREVEKTLQSGRIPVTVLRSSIIIGSGSASFEIIRDLTEKLPVMIAPRWIHSRCQPIAIRDVLFYLAGVLLREACYRKVFDIGGPEAYTFREVLLRYAAFRKLKRKIYVVPFMTPRLSGLWLVLITSVRFSICYYLVESMRKNTVKSSDAIDRILPHVCLPYEEALEKAFLKISQKEVMSTWMDAREGNASVFGENGTVPAEGCFRDVRKVAFRIPENLLLQKVWSIGGDNGWYSMNWAWKLRGFVDRLCGGIGFRRGRKDPQKAEPGDFVDFWRVLLSDRDKGHLILYAEMRLPGEAWLEFKIHREEKFLEQTATFRPKGLAGRAYWYLLWPVHKIIFGNMAKGLCHSS